MDYTDITLEPLTAAHAKVMYPGLCDPQLYTFTDDAPPKSLEDLRRTYKRREKGISPDNSELWFNWIIKHQQIDKCLGYVQATLNKKTRQAEVAYVVFSPYWHQGIAKHATEMMLKHLKENMSVRHFKAVIHNQNLASNSVIQAIGFVETEALNYETVYELNIDRM
ncbi:GNAT family N-acetyltransferase [uncultured Kiloniella sp.]|uniref:GNAT family N-acetyltransferase n=1 Tax=uncultured Kiloniella sp. TaxID=1133091 RepID=UPI0026256BAD|nr:GNAT family N-acetyltransferase [uncultured Kiloniella sp.]